MELLSRSVLAGFYLGYFRGSSFPLPPPSKKCRASPQKILSVIISVYILSNYIRKIIQTWRSQCTHCNISQNWVSKCTRLHLSAYLSQKISGDPPRKLVASSTRDFSPKRQILDRTLVGCIRSTFMDVIFKKTFSKMKCLLKKLCNSLYIPPTPPHTAW